MGDTSPTPHRGASLPATGGTGAPTPTARARTRRSTGPSSARRELQPVESSISQASDHHASPDAAALPAPDETASSEEPTTENLSELLLPAGIFNNIFTCADVTEAISNYLLENHSELAGSLEAALDELREQHVDIDIEAQGSILNAIVPAAVISMHNAIQSANTTVEDMLRINQCILLDSARSHLKTWANSTIGSESVLDKAYDTCNDAVTSGLKKLVELGLLSSALDKRQSDAVDSRNMLSIEDTIAQINAADTEEGSNTLLDESADYTTAKTRIETTAKLIRSDIIDAVCRFVGRSLVKAKNIKHLTFKDKITGEANAKFAREIQNTTMDFMLQTPHDYFCVMMVSHYICEKYRTEDTIICPPSSSLHQDGDTLDLDPVVLAHYSVESSLMAKTLERNSPILLRKLGRGKRRFKHNNGCQVVICPAKDDGAGSLFCIFMAHAQRSASYKLELRDKIENAAGHFTSGSIIKAVDFILPYLEDALQMNVVVVYDMTVRRLGHVLIDRSNVFQHIYDLYCNNPPDKYVNEPLETMYTMILEIADVANETKTHDKLLASATTDDSLRYKARAQAVFGTYDATDYTDLATAHEASSHAVCSITNCQDPVPQNLIDNIKKRSPGKDLSTHTFMCRAHYQKWMAGDVLKYKSGKTKEPRQDRQDRSRGRANATSKNNKSLDMLLAAMEAETAEPSPEPTDDLQFDQSDFDTMTSADKKIKLNMLLARLQSSPEQVARAKTIFEAMQNGE